MILTKLKLKNFSKHRNLEIDLKEGVTGIIGKNGTGKSSIIAALEFLYTGEADQNKEDLITIGEASGYVYGEFILHDKPGSIERHMDCSKVILKYDGKEVKKATEVKDLWAQLLQIDSAVFRNVIIAKQGEIPLLFSGDNSIREKIFQKIFLVPPCAKIQTTIWNNYIKTAPPMLAVLEDIHLLVNNITESEAKVLDIKVKQKNLILLTPEEYSALLEKEKLLLKQTFQEKEIKDKKKYLLELDTKLTYVLQELTKQFDAQYTEDRKNLVDSEIIALDQANVIRTKLLGLESKLKSLVIPEELEIAKITEEFDSLSGSLIEQQSQLAVINSKMEVSQITLNKYSSFTGKATCPTCNKPIDDIQEIIVTEKSNQAIIFSEKTKIQTLVNSIREKQQAVKKHLETLNAQLNSVKTITSEIEYLKKSSNNLEFQEGYYDSLQDYKDRYVSYNKARNELTQKSNLFKAQTEAVERELVAIDTSYFVSDVEEQIVKAKIFREQAENNKNIWNTYNLEIQKFEFQIGELQKKLEENEVNKLSNQKTSEYVALLTEVYDSLATNMFPRMLIQSYSGIITKELNENLASFDIPYTAKVNDSFGIEIFDSENRKLPVVSGGQEVIVGLSLRLALHSLFSQSFSLLIIDEGTTHLDVDNREIYFGILEKLKQEKKINQIVIIDHDSGISNVVDQVVTLQ